MDQMIMGEDAIIDFHTHTFPDAVAARAIAGMEADMRQKGTNVTAKISGTRNELIQSGKKHGIALSIVLPVATSVKQIESINRFAKKTNEKTKENGLLSFGAIHPDCENYKEILNELKTNGILGIKLHPYYQKTDFDDLRYMKIIEYATELGLIVVTHAGKDPCDPIRLRCTPDMIRKVINQVQPKKLVLAHMGGFCCWREAEEKLAGQNVYLDTANCFETDIPHLEDSDFMRMVKSFGEEHILFATDSPWSDQGKYVQYIRDRKFAEETERKILGGNAKYLLGLS